MKYDVLLYEAGLLTLIAAIVYMGFTLRKLTQVVKEKKLIWLLPMLAAVVLTGSLAAHAYANFSLLPQLSAKIAEISSQAVIADQARTDAIKVSIQAIKNSLVSLKTLSFGAFLLASALLLTSTSVYIRWISK